MIEGAGWGCTEPGRGGGGGGGGGGQAGGRRATNQVMHSTQGKKAKWRAAAL